MRILYKYRSWNDKWHKKALIDTEIHFSNSFNFNDPYDLSLPLIIKGDPSYDRNSIARQMISKGFMPTAPELDKLEKVWPQSIRKNRKFKRERKKELAQFTRGEEEKLRLFCLSKTVEDILMWGHYGNGHKGFCFGYDVDEIMNHLSSIYGPKCMEIDVTYSPDLPEIEWDSMRMTDVVALKSFSKKRASTKAEFWIYEQEKRIIIENDKDLTIPFDPNIVREVIFGVNTSEKDIDEIKNVCKKKYGHIKMFRMKRDERTFKITPKPIKF